MEVFLLGRFEVVRAGDPIPRSSWKRRRPADVLKLVALAPGRALARAEVIATLWPEKDPASGANNLHRALYDLRSVLGGRFVDLEHGLVRLRSDVWLDVEAFEAAALSGEPDEAQAAIALYLGDLCPEDRRSPWLAQRRGALRARMAGAALPLARAAAERGDAEAAIPLLRRVLDAEPTVQEPRKLLLRLLAETGRRDEALRQFDACELALRGQGIAADAELRALRDAVARGEIGPASGREAHDGYRRAARRLLGTAGPAPVRGRSSSLLLFESLVEQGAGALVLLGEPGVGKSRLAVEGARIAQEAGALVLTGTCEPLRAMPYAPFADLFAEYARSGGSRAGDPFAVRHPATLPPEAEKRRLLDAVRAALVAIGGGRPVYVLIDDLHRIDESSGNLFHFLARSARALGLMLVGTCREDAVHSGAPVQMLLAHLDCERLARGIRVQRLDLDASRAQLADLLGDAPSEAFAAQFYRVTDGNPFYTEELARAFKESGCIRIPDSAAAAIRERLSRLGHPALALLEAAAVTVRRFDLEIAKAVAGLTTREAVAALELTLEARILDEDGGGYRLHHSLVREAIYENLPVARRSALHRAVADAIEARAAAAQGAVEDVSEELAHHRRAGDQPERAFAHLVTAGRRAATRAGLREANAFLEAALALTDRVGASGPRRLELLESLGEIRLALADLAGAARAFDIAAGLSEASGWRPAPEARARARRGAAMALLAGGRAGEARARIEAAVADALCGPGGERSQTSLLQAQVAWHEGRLRDAVAASRRAEEEARGLGEHALAARARDVWASAAATLGAPAPPVESRQTGPLHPVEADEPEQPFSVHLALWENELLGDRPLREIEAEVSAYLAQATARRSHAGIAVARTIEGAIAASAGRLDAAEEALREAVGLQRDLGSALGEAIATDALARLLTVRGQPEEAMGLLGEGILVAERSHLRRHALARLQAALAQNRLAAGAVYAAEDAVREASEILARHGECLVCHALFRPVAVRVAVLRGRLRDAEREADDLDALAARRGGRGLAAVAREARGRVLAALGRAGEAAAALVEAADAYDARGAMFDGARAAALAARALRADGTDRERAEALARRASLVLSPLGCSAEDGAPD